MHVFRRFLNTFGWSGLARLCLYPLTVFLTTPVRLVQTLWASRVLADGKWRDYNRFSARQGIAYLFYWTQALALMRWGRGGVCPYMGLGRYPLSRGFHYSLPSLYAFYWFGGAVVPLAGLFAWWISHVVWIEHVSWEWTLIVMGLALVSTTVYANAFVLQNYNALGWAFFPLGLYGMATGQWSVAGLAWLAMSFGSFTATVLAFTLCAVLAITEWNPAYVLAICPACVKLVAHLWPLWRSGRVREGLVDVMKAIGMTSRGVKYGRRSRRFRLLDAYYLFLCGQFVVVHSLLTGQFSVAVVTGMVLFALNAGIVRFCDEESMLMFNMSVALLVALETPQPWMLLSLWLLISPLPAFLRLPSSTPVLDVVPKLSPFPINRLIDGMERFLEGVPSGERVLMAMDNPRGRYEGIFDGYRVLVELPLYVAATREIHLMPDWMGIFETNHDGAPEFWGRDVESVRRNVDRWCAEYVLVYQEGGTRLSPDWMSASFSVVGKFSWEDYKEDLRGQPICAGRAPDWWLLRKPRASTLLHDGSGPTRTREHHPLRAMALADLPTEAAAEPGAALVASDRQRLRSRDGSSH